MQQKEFAYLMGKSVSGKSKLWSIRVYECENYSVIETTHGYYGGKMQINSKHITMGKNIGKKNETSHYQQACSEAQTIWQKKKETGYISSIEDMAIEPESTLKMVDDNVPSPMLAHDFNKRGHNIDFPCYVQPKLDGVRCIAMVGSEHLFSRNRKIFPHLQHIIEEINTLPDGFILDGELYSTTLGFQEIVGLVKKETLSPEDKNKLLEIHYYIYDVVIENVSFEERWYQSCGYFTEGQYQYLKPVQTEVCDSIEDMKRKHNEYILNGFEGIMLRNKKGHYRNVRSVDLQKYKEFKDEEYRVIGFKEGQGLEEGCVVWICSTPTDKTFLCRPRGTRIERQKLFQNGNHYIGQYLTVRFQELTDDDIPRFPVGIAFRAQYE
jgi:DNA ligase-1